MSCSGFSPTDKIFCECMTFHFSNMSEMVKAVMNSFPQQHIIVGGRAFLNPDCQQELKTFLSDYPKAQHLGSLEHLEQFIREWV